MCIPVQRHATHVTLPPPAVDALVWELKDREDLPKVESRAGTKMKLKLPPLGSQFGHPNCFWVNRELVLKNVTRKDID